MSIWYYCSLLQLAKNIYIYICVSQVLPFMSDYRLFVILKKVKMGCCLSSSRSSSGGSTLCGSGSSGLCK